VAYIVSFGAALPSRVVTNEEVAPLVGKAPEWIRNVSGISERRWLGSDSTLIELAVAAGQDCLARSTSNLDEIAMVLVSSASWGRQFPGPAAQIASRLGLGDKPALDIPVASAGSLFALSLAADLTSNRGPVLVIAAEVMSEIVTRPPMEPGVAALFGDGAGACLIHPTRGKQKVMGSVLGSDGSFSEDLRLAFGEPLSMNGRSVILQASRKIPRAISEVAGKNGVPLQDISAFIMHQANQNLMDRVADALAVDRGLFYSNIARYGNTSSASMLIAAAEWEQVTSLEAGSRVCYAAFGAGFHWGALLAEME
jgi:3-oxoacyl-[acyl-carrier-protein] synthase-3